MLERLSTEHDDGQHDHLIGRQKICWRITAHFLAARLIFD
jgi:hypothetical protein